MIVMPGANTGFDCGMIFGQFPDKMGQLHSPEDKNGPPRQEFPWALDNGIFGAWEKGTEWSPDPLFRFLEKYSFLRPRWVVVPDQVADRDETLRRWEKYSPALRAFGVPLGFVVQDDMTEADPPECECLFVGGSTEWKWRHLRRWTKFHPHVHVGRVNTYRLLWQAHDAGAESCDGTGWFRGDRRQLAGLRAYLAESGGAGRPQLTLIDHV